MLFLLNVFKIVNWFLGLNSLFHEFFFFLPKSAVSYSMGRNSFGNIIPSLLKSPLFSNFLDWGVTVLPDIQCALDPGSALLLPGFRPILGQSPWPIS